MSEGNVTESGSVELWKMIVCFLVFEMDWASGRRFSLRAMKVGFG